jgi:4-amino-4-deoxy-L-arabinose transferase-like glycosyltransferase
MLKGRSDLTIKYTSFVALFLGLGLAAWLIFWNLGKGSIDLRDEALTAGRSLYIYHTHSLLNLEVNGEISVRKPPLVYALTAMSYGVFGINELGLRIPNAMFGLATFVLIASGAWKTIGPRWAWLAPWLFLGCYNLIRVSREALPDTAFVFGMTLAFIAVFVDLWAGRNKKILMPWLFGIGVATALLSKGPLALFAPLYILLFLIFFGRERLLPYILASTLALVPFAVWLVAQGAAFPQFWSIYLGEEYMERINYQSSFLTQFVRSPLYYLSNFWRWSRVTGVMTVGMTLWLGYICLKKRNERACTISEQVPFFFLSGAWIGFFLLLSLASHKSRRYILPIFPLITLAYIIGVRSLWSLAGDSKKKWLVAAVITISIAVGIEAMASHYMAIPDYLPRRKEVAVAIRPFVERGYPVYTDAPRLAPILHFYLDRIVPVVAGPQAIPDREGIFVSSSPISGGERINKDYYMLLQGQNPIGRATASSGGHRYQK